MKILFCSNYSANSGYSIQAQLLVPRIKAMGHDVSVLGLMEGRSKAHTIEGVTVLPTGMDNLGSDVIPGYVQRGGFHALITLIDPWGMQPDIMKCAPWFPFAPIDTMPVSPRNIAALRTAVRPIALTRWGAAELVKAGFNPLYLPHGYDPSIWHPSDRNAARTALGIPPDVFFVAFVGVNDSLPSRKGIAELLYTWQAFCREHDDVLLYLHTNPLGNIPRAGDHGGINMPAMMEILHLENHPSIKWVDVFRYSTSSIPAAELAQIAAAADVLILPGKGEGFGLPVVEFAACGTPSIVTGFGAMAELASQMGGQLMQFEPDWGWQSAMTARPLINEIANALETAYMERGTEAALTRRKQALAGAQAYAIDTVFMEYGVGVLDTMANLVMEAVK